MDFKNSTRRYTKIELKARIKLIEMVLGNNCALRQAAECLEIKLSTAKIIVKKYREEGVFFESKANKRTRLELEERQAIMASNQLPVHLVQEEDRVASIQNTQLNYQYGNQWPVQIIYSLPQVWEYEHPQLCYFIPFQAYGTI